MLLLSGNPLRATLANENRHSTISIARSLFILLFAGLFLTPIGAQEGQDSSSAESKNYHLKTLLHDGSAWFSQIETGNTAEIVPLGNVDVHVLIQSAVDQANGKESKQFSSKTDAAGNLDLMLEGLNPDSIVRVVAKTKDTPPIGFMSFPFGITNKCTEKLQLYRISTDNSQLRQDSLRILSDANPRDSNNAIEDGFIFVQHIVRLRNKNFEILMGDQVSVFLSLPKNSQLMGVEMSSGSITELAASDHPEYGYGVSIPGPFYPETSVRAVCKLPAKLGSELDMGLKATRKSDFILALQADRFEYLISNSIGSKLMESAGPIQQAPGGGLHQELFKVSLEQGEDLKLFVKYAEREIPKDPSANTRQGQNSHDPNSAGSHAGHSHAQQPQSRPAVPQEYDVKFRIFNLSPWMRGQKAETGERPVPIANAEIEIEVFSLSGKQEFLTTRSSEDAMVEIDLGERITTSPIVVRASVVGPEGRMHFLSQPMTMDKLVQDLYFFEVSDKLSSFHSPGAMAIFTEQGITSKVINGRMIVLLESVDGTVLDPRVSTSFFLPLPKGAKVTSAQMGTQKLAHGKTRVHPEYGYGCDLEATIMERENRLMVVFHLEFEEGHQFTLFDKFPVTLGSRRVALELNRFSLVKDSLPAKMQGPEVQRPPGVDKDCEIYSTLEPQEAMATGNFVLRYGKPPIKTRTLGFSLLIVLAFIFALVLGFVLKGAAGSSNKKELQAKLQQLDRDFELEQIPLAVYKREYEQTQMLLNGQPKMLVNVLAQIGDISASDSLNEEQIREKLSKVEKDLTSFMYGDTSNKSGDQDKGAEAPSA